MPMDTREIWINNVREIMRKAQLSLSEAADVLGTSKQYLSQLLDPVRPLSTRERIMHDLVFLLQTTQSDLFDPNKLKPPLPAIPSMTRKSETSALPANGQELLRQIKAMDEIRDYGELAALCEQAGCGVINELSPGEHADLNYYWGKALINRQRSESGEERIRSALRLFQQRQTHQPETYVPRIIGCYRHLALAAYFSQRFDMSIKHNRMIMSKWQDHPKFVDKNEVLDAATNMLRAAKRGGLYRQVPGLEVEICEFSRRNQFCELNERLILERFSDEAEVADVYHLELKPGPQPDDRNSAEIAYISQGTYLIVKERWEELKRHIEEPPCEAEPNMALHLNYWRGRLNVATKPNGEGIKAALDELLRLRALGNTGSRVDVHIDALRAFQQARSGDKAMAAHYWLNAIARAKAMHLTGPALELTQKMMKELQGHLSDHQIRLLNCLYERKKAEYASYIMRGEKPDA